MMDFRGAAKRLDDIDLPALGEPYGLTEDHLHAFMEAETRGSGFDSLGRPRILFEPHLFWKHLPPSLRKKAADAGLAAPKWGQIKYGKESEQYPRLQKALQIHPEAALKSCSWGLCQVLGENAEMVGYPNVVEFVAAMMQDEENHLKACLAFLEAADIIDDLKAQRWEVVARVYNGPGYRKNQYHLRMAKAFAKWRAIRDTPYETASTDDADLDLPSDVAVGFASLPAKRQWAEQKLTKQEIEVIQKRLRELRYHLAGKVDGKWGSNTTAAIMAFQKDNGLTEDGHWGPETRAAMFDETVASKPISAERAMTTEDDLRAQGSRIVTKADNVTKIGFFGKITAAIGAGIGFLLEYFEEAWNKLEPARDLLGKVPLWIWGALAFVVCVYLGRQAAGIRFARVDDERQGIHLGAPDPSPSPPVEHENLNARPPRTVGFIGQLVGRH